MSTITQLLCNNFGGIRQRTGVFSDEIITAQDIQNVELYHTGLNGGIGIRTTKGNQLAKHFPNENIINIFESVQNENKHFIIHTEVNREAKGKLYLYYQNTLYTIKENLRVTGESNGFDIAQGWSDYFFFTTGKEMFLLEIYENNKQVYTDKIVNTLTKLKPKDRDNTNVIGLGSCLFDNRLFIFNKNKLWYSKKSYITDFGGLATSNNDSNISTTAGYIELTKNITAIHEYAGNLAIFFADSSVMLSTDSNGNFSLSDESTGGCAGYNSLVFHDTDLFFYDDTKKSVFSFKQIVTGEKTLGQNVASEIQEELQSISGDLNKIKAVSVFIKDRNEIWWLIPTRELNRSTIIIYDYLKGEWVKRKCQKLNSIKVIDNKLYSADTNGNLLEEYKGNTFNGEYIQHYYKCSPMNLGAMNTLKVLVFPPRVSFDLPYSNKFYVKYIKNYNMQKKPKIKFIKTKYKNIFTWDESKWNEAYWQAENIGNVGKFPNATFKVLEIEIYTDEPSEESERSNQNFAIKNIEMSKIKVKQV